MPLNGVYEPSSQKWVRDQVELYEGSGGKEGTTLLDRGIPVVVVTSVGAKSGKLRKNPVMRVEHDGAYAVIASKGGAPENPVWFHNMVNDPHVEVQDGPDKWDMTVRLASGDERTAWWDRAVAVYSDYADYQNKTDREIPVFIAERG